MAAYQNIYLLDILSNLISKDILKWQMSSEEVYNDIVDLYRR